MQFVGATLAPAYTWSQLSAARMANNNLIEKPAHTPPKITNA
jgi:hypothetical protein